jgi:hypothetical protein
VCVSLSATTHLRVVPLRPADLVMQVPKVVRQKRRAFLYENRRSPKHFLHHWACVRGKAEGTNLFVWVDLPHLERTGVADKKVETVER